MRLQRRHFVGLGGLAIAAVALPFLFRKRPKATALVADPEGILDLPDGFSYRVLQTSGQIMTDGFRVPSLPDGMAVFPGAPGQLVLLRNHEVTRSFGVGAYSRGNAPPEAFDATAFGAVTRLVLDQTSLAVVSSNLVLTGTIKNCSGGATPWGWLSCEETSEDGHGWVFLCRTEAERVRAPERIAGYGRFVHEAVAFDPTTYIAYLTEDQPDGCLYRFVPAKKEDPFNGKLQALCVVGHDRFDTARTLRPKQKVTIEWMDLAEPDAGSGSLRKQARRAATFCRGEGAFFADNTAYFVATSGGEHGLGQVFRLIPDGDGGTLEVLAEANGESLDCPDNVTVAPFGDVILAEDGSGGNFVRGLTTDGRIYDIARNAASDFETAGVCFSPDGGTLFLNLQVDGITLAVRGPFATLKASARVG